MLRIFKKKYCKERIACGGSLNWDSSNVTLLRITFDLKLSNITQISYDDALPKINNTIGAWKKEI